ncbi:MAG TPA: T9SS type A sorting domain-containing protein, partial [Bacteroidales bacterium]|nr:T9SS type A sorting domain-containing protein [Bacteroidales bacterium]
INSNALIKSIAITDATGREINNITINTDNFEFETSGIVSGIYFICIELENGDLVIKKIIKQ